MGFLLFLFSSLSLYHDFLSVHDIHALLGRLALELAAVQVVPVAIRDIRDIRVRNLRGVAEYQRQDRSTLSACRYLQPSLILADGEGGLHPDELLAVEGVVVGGGAGGGDLGMVPLLT